MRELTLKNKAKLLAVLALSLPLAACGNGGWLGGSSNINHKTKFSSKEYGVSASPRLTTSSNVKKGGGRYQVGKPYKVAGKWYEPAEQPNYDKVGVASWYGPNFHGRLTANGEIFDQNALSAAHPTLPLPSYVRVTNVENGMSTLVRVNDRGPFAHGRLIDLSSKTAEVLGVKQKGTANVRVQYVGKAPLNGDDTRFLVASINRLTDMERGTTQLAFANTNKLAPMSLAQLQNAVVSPTPPVRTPMTQMPSFSGDATNLLASSYAATATGPDTYINDAHRAASALANPAMGAALQKYAAPAFDLSAEKVVGSYTSSDSAHRVAQELALLAIVDLRNSDGATQVVVEALRPGVSVADFNEYAQSLGFSEFTL